MFAAAAGIVVATVGQTVRPLAGISVLAPRDPRNGPQGVPINRTAAQAKVVEAATDPSYRLSVEGNVTMPLSLSIEDLRAMSWREADLPIACVDGWSSTARWGGVALRDVLSAAGAPADVSCTVISLQGPSGYGSADVSDAHVADPDTLLALEINGEPLHIDHGFPVRLIGPDSPGGPADQMGHHGGGRMIRHHAELPPPIADEIDDTSHYGPAFIVGCGVGGACMVFGLVALFTHAGSTKPVNFASFFVGLALLHDLVLVPVVLAVAWVLRKGSPKSARGLIMGAVAVSAIVAVFAIPGLRGWGLQAGNPSFLPRNYAFGLAVSLAVIWLVSGLVLARRLRRMQGS